MGKPTIKDRVKAGRAVIALADMTLEEAGNHPNINIVAIVVERLCIEEPTAIPRQKPVQDPPMSDKEALAFEEKEMPFGNYQKLRMGNVPINYLRWLEEQPDIRRQLNRYMRSSVGQRRQEEGE